MAKRVLIVEDDPDVREAFQMLIQLYGYETLSAAHGGEALALLARDAAIDLIFLDLMMPTMNGWQFLDAKLHDPRIADIPVILLSAALDPDAPIPAGAVAQLSKPVESARLIQELTRLIGPGH